MSKPKFAGVVIAVALLSAGVANAAQSAFPSSPSESSAFSFPYESMHVRSEARATDSVFPSGVSDAGPFSIPAAERATMAERLSGTYSSVFPTSVNESGPL